MRRVLFAMVLAACAFAAWRIVGWMGEGRQPDTAMHQAQAAFAAGDHDGAARQARALLAREPLQGRAFALLAAVADAHGRREEAATLYVIAARRSPRDVATRTWLTRRALERGDYAGALDQVDRILRLDPARGGALYPVLAPLAEDPRFVSALATVLRTDPPWRPALLATWRNPKTGHPAAANAVLQALQQQGGLSAEEYRAWLDSLIADGQWGEAYARWATTVVRSGAPLPLVYNGGFSATPTDTGFDWRLRHVPGVLVQFEPRPEGGQAAHLQFLDQGVATAGLEQPLMLSPGNYRISLRMRLQSLDSALGLQWVIACTGPAGVAARIPPVQGTTAWQSYDGDFTIPASGCPGQWLRLVNPVDGGGAQRVSGELWVDDVHIVPL